MSVSVTFKADNIPLETDTQADTFAAQFSIRLRKCAGEKGWKQADLSRESGVNRKRISEYWRGKQSPSRDNLLSISRALGVNPHWLSGGVNATAEHLLDELDALVEARRDGDVRARRGELQALVEDPDLAPGLRNRVDYMLAAMGDAGAQSRHRTAVCTTTAARDGARAAVEMALDRAIAATGTDIGDGARQALLALAGQLLLSSPADAAPEAIQWSFESLLAAIGSRYGGAMSAPSVTASASLHGRRDDFRGKDE